MVYRAPAGAITVLHPSKAHDGEVCAQEGLGCCVLVLPPEAIASVLGSVSLGELAEVAGVHPGTLLRRFRLEVGLAPYEYLVARRIDLARQLLLAGRPIAEVAMRAGFADQSHLHRHFKRIVGVTPGRFVRS